MIGKVAGNVPNICVGCFNLFDLLIVVQSVLTIWAN